MDETGQTVSSDDRSYLWGDGLFETVRVRADNSVRWLDRHIARLRRSGAALGFDKARIEEAIEVLASLPERQPGLWRITVSRAPEAAPFGGEGSIRVRRRDVTAPTRPRLGFVAGLYLPDDRFAEHKTTSFMRSIEARRRAHKNGYDDAILLSKQGLVGEASCANLVAVIDGQAVTPPVRGILPGVTREGVLELAREAGEAIAVRELTVEEIERADEVVLLSAGVGALAAASLEGRALDDEWTRWVRGRLP